MADKLFELAQTQSGYLGMESTRDESGLGITISYWKYEASISRWKEESDHLIAQKLGIDRFYAQYHLRVAKIERAYSGPGGRNV